MSGRNKSYTNKKGRRKSPLYDYNMSYARNTSLKTALEARLERTLSAKWKETKPTSENQ